MNELVYGVWEGKVIDPANGGATLLSQIEKLGEYEPGNPIRALMGWDGFLLFAEPRGQGDGEGLDLVDMARAYMAMTQGEACGKCVPGRMGTKVAADILARIADGRGEEADIQTLRNVGELVRAGSMCELCHTSMNGVLAMIDRYEDVFRQAIADAGAGSARRPRRRYHTKVTAPCIEACPERLDIPRYIENIKAGRFTESLSVIHEKNPLASVCGRVCVRFCEFACRRGKLDDPINIKHLKRFVSDVEQDAAVKKVAPVAAIAADAKRVAVIGAGPAGVTVAYHLLRRGYAVEIFEALDEPGGMAAVGIPDYRLPREVLRSEVEVIRQMGAAIHYEQRLGRDFTLQSLPRWGLRCDLRGDRRAGHQQPARPR